MLTPTQQKWVDHLSDTNKVEIFPLDSKCNKKFEQIKSQIQSAIGTEFEILHRGASSLGISGQKEIDVYIPIPGEMIQGLIPRMEQVFGKPSSIYLLERTKFRPTIDGTVIEIMLINKEHESWIRGERFYEYLKENPETLEKYKKLKEDATGVSTREYYRRKIEFINEVLEVAL
jgi:GrpB-like predicted nucleotidyltransferase (UPF0157 family)